MPGRGTGQWDGKDKENGRSGLEGNTTEGRRGHASAPLQGRCPQAAGEIWQKGWGQRSYPLGRDKAISFSSCKQKWIGQPSCSWQRLILPCSREENSAIRHPPLCVNSSEPISREGVRLMGRVFTFLLCLYLCGLRVLWKFWPWR